VVGFDVVGIKVVGSTVVGMIGIVVVGSAVIDTRGVVVGSGVLKISVRKYDVVGAMLVSIVSSSSIGCKNFHQAIGA
jgi:hypothetical protein